MTSDGLSFALGGWGFRNKRVVQFNFRWVLLVHATADRYEAKTGVNPITKLFEEKLGSVAGLRKTIDRMLVQRRLDRLRRCRCSRHAIRQRSTVAAGVKRNA